MEGNGDTVDCTTNIHICLVCGDGTSGRNFGVFTCESCKIFFTRHALKKSEELRCKWDENCVMDVINRKRCVKCRLAKCLQVGMKPERIRKPAIIKKAGTSSGKRKKGEIEIIECSGKDPVSQVSSATPLAKRTDTQDEAGSSHNPSSSQPSVTALPSGTIEDPSWVIRIPSSTLRGFTLVSMARAIMDKIGPQFEVGEPSAATTSDIQYAIEDIPMQNEMGLDPNQSPNEEYASRNIAVTLDQSSALHSESPELLQNLNADFIDDALDAFDFDWQRPLPSPHSLQLALNRLLLDELHMSTEVWFKNTARGPQLSSCINETDFTYEHGFNIIFRSTVCNLKQFSQLNAFENLPRVDKEPLIKNVMGLFNFLRHITTYDPITDTVDYRFYPGITRMPVRIINLLLGKTARKVHQLSTAFPSHLRQDESLVLILCACALFNPNLLPHSTLVTNKKAIETEWNNYMQLLKEYLNDKYNETEARWSYAYLRQWMEYLYFLIRNEFDTPGKIYFDINPDTFDLLLIEFRPS